MIASAALAHALAWGVALSAPIAPSTPAARPHPAVCRIVVPEGDGTMSLGSGTLVGSHRQLGLVVTNWHVVRHHRGTILVVFSDGFRSAARLLRADADWDLAALAIWKPAVEPVPLAAGLPRRGDRLTIAGYGGGNYREATGRCTQYAAPADRFPFEMIELSVAARQGDSGGPIFNERGEIAGVLFGAGMGRTIGSYSGRVREFLLPTLDAFCRLSPPEADVAEAGVATTPPSLAPAAVSAAAVAATPSAIASPPIGAVTGPRVAFKRPPPRPASPPTPAPSPPPAPAVAALTGPTAASGSPAEVDAEAAEAGWSDVAGSSIGEQGKTVLAIIGAAALFLNVVSALGARRPAAPRRQPGRRRQVQRA